MWTSQLGCGPMSPEVIEAVYSYSHKHGVELMLIASRNQVDRDGGYVSKTSCFATTCARMRAKYPDAQVRLCRDHCGPGFGGTCEVADTIRCDLEHGFELIHIDLSNLSVGLKEKVRATATLMTLALEIDSKTEFEIGTDANTGVACTSWEDVAYIADYFEVIKRPLFQVVRTGSLVRGAANVGEFDKRAVVRVSELLHAKGVRVKEHNADYLDRRRLDERIGIVDAVNIAPQLGAVQTSWVLHQCTKFGIGTRGFMDRVSGMGKWRKWFDGEDRPDPHVITVVAGHYHFGSSEYQRLVDTLGKHLDVKAGIMAEIEGVIDYYQTTLSGGGVHGRVDRQAVGERATPRA